MAKITEEEAVLEVVKSNIGPEGHRQSIKAQLVDIGKGIKSPRLTRNGEAPMGVAEATSGNRKEDMSKSKKAAILILDILEEEGEQEQGKLFDRVAQEIGLTPATVQRKAYWGILQPDGLVKGRPNGFGGPWIVSRSDKERPENLASTKQGKPAKDAESDVEL